jgi:hypothetical protein
MCKKRRPGEWSRGRRRFGRIHFAAFVSPPESRALRRHRPRAALARARIRERRTRSEPPANGPTVLGSGQNPINPENPVRQRELARTRDSGRPRQRRVRGLGSGVRVFAHRSWRIEMGRGRCRLVTSGDSSSNPKGALSPGRIEVDSRVPMPRSVEERSL